MKRIRKYQFITSSFFLGLFLILYYISALFIPLEISDRWIPAFIGFLDLEAVPRFLSILSGALFIILTAISLYFFNERNILIGHSSVLLPIIYLIFSFSYPNAVYFSGLSVASLFVVWSLYYSLFSRKGFKELFISGFLISIATLFEPYIAFLIPVILFFSLRAASVNARTVIVVLCSLLVPFAFMFSLRFLFFQDIMFLEEIYINAFKSIGFSSLNMKNFADLIKILTLFVYICLAVRYSILNINRYKILKSHSFLRLISILVISFLVELLYPKSGESLMQIISIPASVFVLEYISSKEKPTRKRVGYLLVLIFMTMSRIAAFI